MESHKFNPPSNASLETGAEGGSDEKQDDPSSRVENNSGAAVSSPRNPFLSVANPHEGMSSITGPQQHVPYVDFASSAAAAQQIGQLALAYGQLPQLNAAALVVGIQTAGGGTSMGTSTQEAANLVFGQASNLAFSAAGFAHLLSQVANYQQPSMTDQYLQHVASLGGQQQLNSLLNFHGEQQGNLLAHATTGNIHQVSSASARAGVAPPEQLAERTRPSKVLSLEQDTYELSPYQCLVRKQIEVFEQPPNHLQPEETTQGRNRPVVAGQVGIRCRHCAAARSAPRTRGAVLFPSTLLGVYQAAQNMANTHLVKLCKMIPVNTHEELIRVRTREKGKKTRKSAHGGGRQYWANSLGVLGVAETPDKRLRFEASLWQQQQQAAAPPPGTIPGLPESEQQS
jgi:hypothetical protein